MSKCNFTQYVSPNTCIGDSLATFNNNFLKLDEGLCSISKPVPGPGIIINTEQTEQENDVVRISAPSVVYDKDFEFQSNSVENFNISLGDGSLIQATAFYNITAEPYYSNSDVQDPFVTLSVVLPNHSLPKLTLFWTASGVPDDTLYNTNSSNSLNFNGQVNTLAVADGTNGEILYVGGDFTTVNNQQCRKFCRISLTTGVTGGDVNKGRTSTLLSSPLTAINSDLGSFGSVNAIKESGDYLIVGGSFQSLTHGRGLVVVNKTTKELFPFYINGVVKSLEIQSSVDEINIYVGGSFDFLNYGAQSVSNASGLRVFTNGLAKISLSRIIQGFPNSSIDKTFCANQAVLYNGSAIINTIHSISQRLYIGGLFEIRTNSLITAKNLAVIAVSPSQGVVGRQYSIPATWSPIVNGEVHKITSNGIFIYVAGSFSKYYTATNFYDRPLSNSEEYDVYNLMSFQYLDPNNGNALIAPSFEYTWKPKFNGPVTEILLQGEEYIYCTGKFSRIGNKAVNGAAVVSQNYVGNNPIVYEYAWNITPSRIPNTMVYTLTSIVLGGSFTHFNSSERRSLARTARFNTPFAFSTTKPVIWQVAAQPYFPGVPLSLSPTTTFVSTSAYSNRFGTVNQTELSLDPTVFRFTAPGDLVRFFIKRPKKNDLFPQAAHAISWKLDFN